MNNKSQYVPLVSCVKESWVHLAGVETKISKDTQKSIIPFPSGLFEPIKQLFQSLDGMLPLIFISRQHLHVDFFIFLWLTI
jgi:hypothetical protein